MGHEEALDVRFILINQCSDILYISEYIYILLLKQIKTFEQRRTLSF